MILAYQGVGLISRRIRATTRGPYSHIAWQRLDGSVIEAWGTGGGFLKWAATGKAPKGEIRHVASASDRHTPGTLVDAFNYHGMESQRERIEAFLLEQVGDGYDYRGVLSFKTLSDRASDEDWFCSEMICEAVRHAGTELHRRVKSHMIDPTWLTRSAILNHAYSFTTLAEEALRDISASADAVEA